MIFCVIVLFCCVLDLNPEGVEHTITISFIGVCVLFFLKGAGFLFFRPRIVEKKQKSSERPLDLSDLDECEREALRQRRRRTGR